MKRLIYDFERTHDILGEARDKIAQVFEYLREDQ